MKKSLWVSESIPHYYGNYVRAAFIAAAGLSFVVTPLWGDLLPFPVVLQVAAALALVLLAGLTSPQGHLIMIANAAVSAISIVLLESAAIIFRTVGPHYRELFVARELNVLLLLGALYFSMKTIRGMMAGKTGHNDSPLDFVGEQDTYVQPIQETETFPDVSDYNE